MRAEGPRYGHGVRFPRNNTGLQPVQRHDPYTWAVGPGCYSAHLQCARIQMVSLCECEWTRSLSAKCAWPQIVILSEMKRSVMKSKDLLLAPKALRRASRVNSRSLHSATLRSG